MMFNQTVMMAKSTQKWLSHGKKKESVVNKPLSKDYRNIIEGLQVWAIKLFERDKGRILC
jgi:hypothetical protein